MVKPLIIAEKPSVARAIAAGLGCAVQRAGYLETPDYLITNCIGHLFSIMEPGEMNPDWAKWSRANLPMIPENFKYKPNAETASQWKIVRALIESPDVSTVINACDAGREGELIFWLAFNHAGVSKPVKRLWISSLTEEAVKKGFAELKDARAYQNLTDAAFLRQFADWVIGLNATQAFTLAAGISGQMFSLGRVQTPTLALVALRDEEIETFVVRPFYNVAAVFSTASGNFTAHLTDALSKVTRFNDSLEAETLLRQIQAETVAPRIKSVEKTNQTARPPLLFHLTALQREMNAVYGLTGAKTLEVAQSLYEKKFLTYPRTSSAYLSQTVFDTDVRRVLENLGTAGIPDLSGCAEKIQSSDWLRLSERHIDDSKVTDHHAIIPTSVIPPGEALTADEKNVYAAVAKRFLAAFYPDGIDQKTHIVVELGKFLFSAKGIVVLQSGWREILKNQAEDVPLAESDADEDEAGNSSLPPVTEQAPVALASLKKLERETRPPKRYNESSLLGAMETAGRLLSDEETRQAMKDCGLGTPSTRAATIEKLIRQQYVERKGKQLISTSKARQVIKELSALNSILVSPELTGKWENQLELIAAGRADKAHFELSVKNLAAQIVADTFSLKLDIALDHLDSCPKCVKNERNGILKEIKAASGKYLVCSAGRDVCGYISQVPSTKKQKAAMLAATCPSCAAPMVFRTSKSGAVDYLGCSVKDCRGVVWFDAKKSGAAKKPLIAR